MYPFLPLLLLLWYQTKEPAQVKHLKAEYEKWQYDPSATEETKIKVTVESYFKMRYEMLKTLRPLNMNFLVDEKPEDLFRIFYELQQAKKHDLGLKNYDFTLDYQHMEMGGRTAILTLLENHNVNYGAFSDITSRLKGKRHEITLVKRESGWKISSVKTRDPITEAAATLGKPLDQFFLEAAKKIPIDLGEAKQKRATTRVNRSFYNRQAAVNYAHRWVLEYNPAYGNFSNMGGDCTNFASQVVHAGGKPMDHSGPLYEQWYYYSFNNRMPSWTGVNEFYTYLTSNTSGGATAQVVPLKEVEPGDIVQLDYDASDARFNHSPVVLEVREPGNPAKILMAAHNGIMAENFPLGNYYYERLRPLHII